MGNAIICRYWVIWLKNKLQNNRTRREALLPVIVLIGILTAGWWVTPAEVEGIPTCFVRYFLHIDCPGCGLTRSFLSIASGDIGGALHFNAAGPLLYFFFLALLINFIFKMVKGKELNIPAWTVRFYSFVTVFFLFGHWLVRLSYQIPSIFLLN